MLHSIQTLSHEKYTPFRIGTRCCFPLKSPRGKYEVQHLLRSNECEAEKEMGSNREITDRTKRVTQLIAEYKEIRPYFFGD